MVLEEAVAGELDPERTNRSILEELGKKDAIRRKLIYFGHV